MGGPGGGGGGDGNGHGRGGRGGTGRGAVADGGAGDGRIGGGGPGARDGASPAPGLPALEYPQHYVFKAIGLAGDDFAEHVRAVVARLVPDAGRGTVAVRISSGGKYHSVSVTIRLESESQRRAVYEALHADVRVVYCL
jgi:putative lipoic acid-binding regulatory protein